RRSRAWPIGNGIGALSSSKKTRKVRPYSAHAPASLHRRPMANENAATRSRQYPPRFGGFGSRGGHSKGFGAFGSRGGGGATIFGGCTVWYWPEGFGVGAPPGTGKPPVGIGAAAGCAPVGNAGRPPVCRSVPPPCPDSCV